MTRKLGGRKYHCNVRGLTIYWDLNAEINILNIVLKKVGRGNPGFTPVKSATAAELSEGSLRVVTL
jgi:transposase